jgi:hypothetical protein
MATNRLHLNSGGYVQWCVAAITLALLAGATACSAETSSTPDHTEGYVSTMFRPQEPDAIEAGRAASTSPV